MNCGNIIGVRDYDKIKMKIIICCLFLLIQEMPKVAFGAEKIKKMQFFVDIASMT